VILAHHPGVDLTYGATTARQSARTVSFPRYSDSACLSRACLGKKLVHFQNGNGGLARTGTFSTLLYGPEAVKLVKEHPVGATGGSNHIKSNQIKPETGGALKNQEIDLGLRHLTTQSRNDVGMHLHLFAVCFRLAPHCLCTFPSRSRTRHMRFR